MGEVYRARDPRLGRAVAIKVLPERVAQDPAATARFEREAKAVAALSHPNILAIHDVGVEGEIRFAVTELLEGETLRSRLGRGPMRWPVAAEIAAQVADGLAAAHTRGIVHRDLKPENVFLTADGRVKVLDFGLARWVPESERTDSAVTASQLTEPGTVMGTVGYMSPEQVRGLPVDARSDVFSLGAVLHEMLCGRRAFAGRTAGEVLAAVLHSEPGPVGTEAGRQPAALEQALARCLEKEPARRPAAAEIAGILRGLPAGGARARRGWLRGAAAAIVLAVLATAGVLSWRRSGALFRTAIDSVAVLPLENLSRDAEEDYFVDGTTEALINELARIGTFRVTSRTSVMQYKGARQPLPEIARKLDVDGVVEGSVLRAGERVRVTAQLIDAGEDRQIWGQAYERDLRDVLSLQRELAAAIAREVAGRLAPPDLRRPAPERPVDPRAYESYLKGRHAFWRVDQASLLKSRDHYEDAITADPGYALAHAGLADTYVTLGVFGFLPPAQAYPRAEEAARKALAIDDSLGEAVNALAVIRRDYGWQWGEAEELFRRAVDLSPQHVYAHHMLGIHYAWTGRFDEAAAELARARELDPLNLAVNSDIAYVARLAGRLDASVRQYLLTIDLDPSFVVSHRELAATYELKGMLPEAEAELRKALALSPEVTTRLWLARVLALSGRATEARGLLEELERAGTDLHVPPFDSALVYEALGELDRAFESLERAYAIRDIGLATLKVERRLGRLRSDPRFPDLLRRVGLP